MRHILSCMFSLTPEQVTVLKHYSFNVQNEFVPEQVDMSTSVTMRKSGRYSCMVEAIEINEDTLTKNINIMMHLKHDGDLEDIMRSEGTMFVPLLEKNLRSGKLSIKVVYDGFKC